MGCHIKTILGLLVWSSLLAESPTLLRAQAPLPVILHASWKAAKGNAIGIYGSNFKTSSTTRVAIQPLSAGVLDPASASFALPLLNVQNNLIEGILPSNLPGDVYALWVNNGNGWSSPAFVNRAQVFWASEGEVYAGQSLRFIGRNFQNPVTGTFEGLQVIFITLDGATSVPATVTQASDYAVDVSVPSALQAGVSYTAKISNGAGAANGWAQMEDQASFLAVSSNANIQVLNQMFGVNAANVADIPVGQVFNAASYGAVGDGQHDNTSALQAALNAVHQAGGGILNIPAGTYNSRMLIVYPKTVVAGAGSGTTTLVYTGAGAAPGYFLLLDSGSAPWQEPTILANFSIVSNWIRPTSAAPSLTLVAGPGTGLFVEHMNLQSADGDGIAENGPGDIIIENSKIKTPFSSVGVVVKPGIHIRIRNNTFTNTVKPQLVTFNLNGLDEYTSYNWIEGNNFVGSGCVLDATQVGCTQSVTQTDSGEHRILDFGSKFAYIANNSSSGEFGGPNFNDGEGINFQPNDRLVYSQATGGGPSTLADSSQSFSANQLVPAIIAIIGGTGIGQIRTITKNDSTQITVNSPWTVVPDNTSLYTVDAGVAYHNIVVTNNLQAIESAFAIGLTTKSYDNIIASNVIANSAGINTNAVVSRDAGGVYGPVADFAYFDYVSANTISGGSDPLGNGVNLDLIGILDPYYHDDTLHSTVVYGDEYRGNAMTGAGTNSSTLCTGTMNGCGYLMPFNGINFSIVGGPGLSDPPSYPFAQGVLVENNTITNALAGLHLANTAYDTLLYNNNFNGNGVPLIDRGSVRTVSSSSSSGSTALVPVAAVGSVPTGSASCAYSLSSTSDSVGSAAASGTVSMVTTSGCSWTAISNTSWLTISSGSSGSGDGTVAFSVAANSDSSARTGILTIGGQPFTVTQSASTASAPPLAFYALTPCRIADTRSVGGSGLTGSFGPPSFVAGGTRTFPIQSSGCNVPATAQAYSLNFTVVPAGPLNYLTTWPAGQSQPLVSTLNDNSGGIVANAAIVEAGTSGSIDVFAHDATDVIIDINGYFAPSTGAQALAFYALTPCRVVDTRNSNATFGGPELNAQQTRSFPLPSSACGIPASAQAYSLNMTAVPPGPLDFLTVWPAGQSQPLVSTLNDTKGEIVANAAIVPAGTNGAVNVFAYNPSNVIMDINGYFAPPGSTGALNFYTLTPCRIADTRTTPSGTFAGPALSAAQTRSFPILSSSCNVPANAQAYSLNLTVVPAGPLRYLSIWPDGQAQPLVSTLNDTNGEIVANAAIVAGGTNGAVDIFTSDATDLIIDINGYFAP